MERKMETTIDFRVEVSGGMGKKLEATIGCRAKWKRNWKLL